MPKGQQRSNRETKKPKKSKQAPNPPSSAGGQSRMAPAPGKKK